MIRNLVEEHVLTAYQSLLPSVPDFCDCETCRTDVLVYALNRLPARYVAGREGTVVTELHLDKDQSRVTIDVVVLEGFRRVGLAPRCSRSKAAKP